MLDPGPAFYYVSLNPNRDPDGDTRSANTFVKKRVSTLKIDNHALTKVFRWSSEESPAVHFASHDTRAIA